MPLELTRTASVDSENNEDMVWGYVGHKTPERGKGKVVPRSVRRGVAAASVGVQPGVQACCHLQSRLCIYLHWCQTHLPTHPASPPIRPPHDVTSRLCQRLPPVVCLRRHDKARPDLAVLQRGAVLHRGAGAEHAVLHVGAVPQGDAVHQDAVDDLDAGAQPLSGVGAGFGVGVWGLGNEKQGSVGCRGAGSGEGGGTGAHLQLLPMTLRLTLHLSPSTDWSPTMQAGPTWGGWIGVVGWGDGVWRVNRGAVKPCLVSQS
jgi:hypothetical protein